ncbi:MAG TPA: type II secretion system ATPase GspE [candidate division Zixibacteria bacterium]|nr:type II secretion system ATPase GspE [candidate division Zixibacteria bacterium]
MNAYSNLAERLIERRLLSAEEMERVQRLQEEHQSPLIRLIVELGFLSEDDLLPVLRDHFDIPLMSLKEPATVPLALEFAPGIADFLRQARMVPVKIEGKELIVATTDPLDLSRLHALELAAGMRVRPVLAKEKEILARIETLFGNGYAAEGAPAPAAREIEGAVDEEDVAHLRDMASEVPVIRLVNQMLVRALESRASDVHIEPFENQLKVRYRIDGILHDVEPPPRQLKAAVISRLKILAQLNIAERRLPQDGRIKIRLAGKDVDLRISTVPTLYGESVVIRLLERAQIFTRLDSLGFPPEILERFNEMIAKPHGMILVTGPTGSGKTTTLYGALQKINDPGKKIITIEDPVEYQLTGVNQIQVKPQIGLTFANGLRSIVRQDPDVIMVGEIRDTETAEIAVQAALTGHLVFSTLHTNDAAGAISRLLEMGVQDYLLSSSLLGVLAQRLVRRLCTACRRETPFTGLGPAASELGNGDAPRTVWEAVGCEACSGTGYLGRIGIFELLPVTAEICKVIVQRADAGSIRNLAVQQGMRLLRQDGWSKVRQGITTLAEVLRVTREEI